MNDLTSVLIGTPEKENVLNISASESLKQSRIINFESGATQSIGSKSVPRTTIDLQYTAISQEAYDNLDTAYQLNHSNTFLVDFGDSIDVRILYDRKNNGVWAFANFEFMTSIDLMNANEKRYSGKITLLTSVLFNYVEFSSIFNQPSGYSPAISTNTDFLDVLDIISPQSVDYGYQLNSKVANLGQSVQTQRDIGNSKRTWKLKFLCKGEQWIELITFFRKKGGINLFGMPKEGYFIDAISQQIINARFKQDSFTHQKIIGGIHIVTFEIIEEK